MHIFTSLKSKLIGYGFRKTGKGFVVWGAIDVVHPKNISVGDNVSINHQVYLNATAPIIIGSNVAISSGAKLITTSILPEDLYIKKHYSESIVIGDNVQIGAGSIILPGVSIGCNVIVGAGAVVSKNVGSDCIVAGVPAKLIRNL